MSTVTEGGNEIERPRIVSMNPVLRKVMEVALSKEAAQRWKNEVKNGLS